MIMAHVSYLVLISGPQFIPGLWVVLFVPAVDMKQMSAQIKKACMIKLNKRVDMNI